MRVFGGGRCGSIPACAGEPFAPLMRLARLWVYPRVCGGAERLALPGNRTRGLSPRVRGSHQDGFFVVVPGGLSPRVRGSLRKIRRPESVGGSIPACAGEPSARPLGATLRRVYPRVCGGAESAPCPILSPRVRGSPHRITVGVGSYMGSIPACAGEPTSTGRPLFGSIPACAGEPRVEETTIGNNRVYPRVCGGALSEHISIVPRQRVYPRVCGGARSIRCHRRLVSGLSPRVRGSLVGLSQDVVLVGSIPACAGEPDPT